MGLERSLKYLQKGLWGLALNAHVWMLLSQPVPHTNIHANNY